jgi:hypothetical protein
MGIVCAGAERIDTGYTVTIPATGAITMATWFKIPAAGTGVLMGSGKVIAASFNRAQINCQATNKVRVYSKDDALTVVNATSNKTVLDNLWHHVAGVVDAANDIVKVIVDGQLDNTATGVIGAITLDGFDFTPGCLHNEAGYSNYITGVLCEPAIYTRALSIPEVRMLMAGRPPLAGLAVYYPMKRDARFGTSCLVNEATPYLYNGTLQGSPRIVPCPGIKTPWRSKF